jgi:Flp pilus assembly pilin Flp
MMIAVAVAHSKAARVVRQYHSVAPRLTTRVQTELPIKRATKTLRVKRKKMAIIKKLLTEESGLELSEYAIAAALITIALIVTFTNLGGRVINAINELITWMTP